MQNMLTQALVSPVVAQSQAPSGAPGGNMFLIVMVLMFVGMYFLTIAPQRKKEKEHKKMLSELQSGDEILTAGGIYGVITNVKDDRFVVRIADGAKVEIAKGFVNTCVKKASSAS
jgi:preprotein translocase subunit YajC